MANSVPRLLVNVSWVAPVLEVSEASERALVGLYSHKNRFISLLVCTYFRGETVVAFLGNCYALPQPANGQITYTSLPNNNVYSMGTSATLTCYPGYTPLGSSSAYCQQTGWSALSLGACMQSAFG